MESFILHKSKLSCSVPDFHEQNLMPAGLKNPEEIQEIHDKFIIDFSKEEDLCLDPDQVSRFIKRGRQELDSKRAEYKQKKEELEAKWRRLEEEEKEVKQRIDFHQLQVDSVEWFKAQLVKVFRIYRISI